VDSVDYRWTVARVDFIYLDNASTKKFDAEQLSWFEEALDQDEKNANVKTVVVGMHAALPGSLGVNHSMDQSRADAKERAVTIYKDLVTARHKYHKNIYVLASHAHYFADDIFNAPYWQKNGGPEGILPGWIVGTAGARFYQLPEGVPSQPEHRMANVYGYLLSTVGADNQISFEFREIREADIRAALAPGYKDTLVQFCVEQNGKPN
jgi:3',5'-cyclic AMP phosphodiesterase CpdA